MANPKNITITTGNLARPPHIAENKDGSKVVLFTLAIDDNFRSGPNKEYGVHYLSFEHFIPKTGSLGIYPKLTTGSNISVISTAKDQRFTRRDGQKVSTVVMQVDQLPQNNDSGVRMQELYKRQAEREATKQAQAQAQVPNQA